MTLELVWPCQPKCQKFWGIILISCLAFSLCFDTAVSRCFTGGRRGQGWSRLPNELWNVGTTWQLKDPNFSLFLVFWGCSYLFRPDPLSKCIFDSLYFMYSRSRMFLEMYLLYLKTTTTKPDPEDFFFVLSVLISLTPIFLAVRNERSDSTSSVVQSPPIFFFF